ncbi:paraquat-inducible protein A [Halovulum marinum]|uniref:paraquat-inducible protein A n=1 Tax=Halovulum marinum TaxID=2662447 RepID=UPI002D76DBB0|nr:paraquat-inducible protein A [Halovulum marinum]
MLRWTNLALLVLFPVSWVAPLARAGLLPLFGLDEISVLTGIRALWGEDRALAALVALLAVAAPAAKTAWLALIHFGALGPRGLPVLGALSKLAMADVFLVAVYIVLARGVGVGRVETAWGLWLFTACVLVSMAVTHLTRAAAWTR